MYMSYEKLFDMMHSKNITKYDLRNYGLSPSTITRLYNHEHVSTYTIAKLCAALKCQPGDIMEYVTENVHFGLTHTYTPVSFFGYKEYCEAKHSNKESA